MNRAATSLTLGLVFILTLVVFWPARSYDFINYDDPDYFAQNPLVQGGLTGEGIRQAFTTTPIGNWDPAVWLSFMLDVQLFGRGPAGPHFTNILLHAANAALVFLLLNTMTGRRWRALVVALLFALHPLRVESVAWITERKDVLSGFFALLALLAYVSHALGVSPAAARFKFRVSIPYGLTMLFFILALMSKPMVITLPCVMLLLDHWPLRRWTTDNWRAQLPRLAVEKIPFFVLAVAVAATSFIVHQKANALAPLADAPLMARWANAFVAYASYVGKTFWPAHLALPYPRVAHWPVVISALSAALVIGASVMIVRQIKNLPFVFTGWFWFIGMLVPVIGVVQWGDQAMADRFTYLPAIGFLILLVWLAGDAAADWGLSKRVCGAGAAVAIVACIVVTRGQLRHWQNSGTLFRHAIAVTDGNYVAHCNVGLFEAEQGHLDEAMEAFARALEINPLHPISLNNLGATLYRKARLMEAGNLVQRALEADPAYPAAWFNRGQIRLAKREFKEAAQDFETALRLKPAYRQAEKELAVVLLHLDRNDEAVTHLRSLARRAPADVEVLSNLGTALAMRGELAEAEQYFQTVVRLAPENADAHFNLGNAMLSQQRREGAIQQYREVLRLRPEHAGAREQLRGLGVE